MIFVTHFGNSRAAKEYLSRHLSKGDYFAKDAERLAPTWEGKTAQRLGLEGHVVTPAAFGALSDNLDPTTGDRLTPRTKQTRRAMTDLTFDVPKSVSVAGLRDDRVKSVIDAAVDETMREIEADMATRVRTLGRDEDRTTGNMIWAMWRHDTTRPLDDGTVDPQEHRHVTVMNVTWDEAERRFKAGQLGQVVRDKGYFQAAYHARLARKLGDLGYAIERDGTSFRVAGISRDLCDTFSRRHAVIDEAARALGDVSKEGRATLAKVTRLRKGLELSTRELRESWLARLAPEEVAAIDNARHARVGRSPQIDATRAVAHAVEHVFERESAVSERRLAAEALAYGVGAVLPDDVARAMRARNLIRVEHGGQWMTTTRDVLATEQAMLAFARDGRGQYAPLGDPARLPEGLTAEQGAAAAHVLHSRDAVVAVRGAAGTGKTHMMKATIGAIEAENRTSEHPERRVHVFAPSAQASRGVLRGEGFAQADTLESLLSNATVQERTRDQVIWLDEAGLVSNRDMARLFDFAKRNNNRVVLSGDYRQNGAVQAGDALRLLETEGGVRFAELKKIRRQRPEEYRRAIEAISEGTRDGARRGFDRLDAMGAIVETPGQDRHDRLVRDYLEAVEDGRTALIISPTHAEGDRLSDSVREALKQRGRLAATDQLVVSRKATGWTAAQKRDARNYEPGMVVEFHQHVSGETITRDGKREKREGFARGERVAVDGERAGRVLVVREDGREALLPDRPDRFEVYRTRSLPVAQGERLRITKNLYLTDGDGKPKRLNNGDLVDVVGFTPDGDLHLAGGVVLPKTAGHIAGGYVQTSHAAQGRTVDAVFIAVGDHSLPAVDARSFYVSASRARETVRFYVEDKREVRDAIARSGARLSAVELVRPTTPSAMSRVREAIVRHRVTRFLKSRADSLAAYWRRTPTPPERRGVLYG